jgi:dihydrofolate reductase
VLIAAMDRNRVIGKGGAMPWRLPDDLKRFKALTLGHTVVMGRKTLESIGKPLSGRKNVVVSRNPAYRADGCMVVGSVEAALAAAGSEARVFVAGGGELYAATIGTADRLLLTHVDAEVDGGDAFFPEVDPATWRVERREEHPADARHPYAFAFVDYDRR